MTQNSSSSKSVSVGWWLATALLLVVGVAGVVLELGGNGAASVAADNPPAPLNTGDTGWMLAASALVLFMTPGLSFFYGGLVRKKNLISTMLQSFVAMGVVSVAWVVVGFSLAFGDSIGGVIGNPFTFFFMKGVGGATHPDFSPTIPFALFALFQMKFAIITPALITGAFAERVRFSAYLVFILIWSLLIYSPIAHMTWHPNGLLRVWGVLDFAGGTVVHMSAGIAALAGALFFGPRLRSEHEPSNVPFVLLGAGMLWFGWFGFNAGSALAANETATLAFLNTNTASAAAMLMWMFVDVIKGKKPSATGGAIGAVVGLVAITPGAGFVSLGSSVIIGVIGALVSNLISEWRSSRTGLDDTLDVFPCHGVGGLTGMLLTGVFATSGGLITGETTLFTKHLATAVIVSVFFFLSSWIVYKITDYITPLRVKASEEDQGLDLSQHNETVV